MAVIKPTSSTAKPRPAGSVNNAPSKKVATDPTKRYQDQVETKKTTDASAKISGQTQHLPSTATSATATQGNQSVSEVQKEQGKKATGTTAGPETGATVPALQLRKGVSTVQAVEPTQTLAQQENQDQTGAQSSSPPRPPSANNTRPQPEFRVGQQEDQTSTQPPGTTAQRPGPKPHQGDTPDQNVTPAGKPEPRPDPIVSPIPTPPPETPSPIVPTPPKPTPPQDPVPPPVTPPIVPTPPKPTPPQDPVPPPDTPKPPPNPDPVPPPQPPDKPITPDPPGIPPGSVTTPGGYTIVPEGDTNWSIYGPGTKPPQDDPITRIHGDPHVAESDGGQWDFTKDGAFELPDGTKVYCDTSSDEGKSTSSSLHIVNGSSHTEISDLAGRPTIHATTNDGEAIAAKFKNADVFKLGGDGDDWWLVRDGKNLGEITGANFNEESNQYDVTFNGKPYHIDPSLRQPLGSTTWANNINSNLTAVDGQPLPHEDTQAMADLALVMSGLQNP